MRYVTEHYLTVDRLALVGADIMAITASTCFAVWWRLGYSPAHTLSPEGFLYQVILIVVVHMGVLSAHDLYTNALHQQISFGRLARQLSQSVLVASCILWGLYYLIPQLWVGRGVFLINMVALPLLLSAARMGCWWFGLYEAQGRRTLVMGEAPEVHEVSERMKGVTDYPLIGAVVPDDEETAGLDVNVLGHIGQLKNLVRTYHIHEVVVALHERRGRLPLQDLLMLKLLGIQVDSKDSFLERVAGRLPVTGLTPSALVFADGFKHITLYARIKAVPDMLAAGIFMVALSPLMGLLALLIRLDSPGPVLYRQVRVGFAGNLFEILKFRTMRADAEAETGARFASVGDPRVTRVGRFLRRSRLDELPQLVNIFKGQMAFVGPRPERPEFVAELQKQIPFYYLRTAVKPGLTGWAQVRYPYGATLTEHREKLEHDLYYIKNMSLTLDVLIAAETGRVVLFGRGAR